MTNSTLTEREERRGNKRNNVIPQQEVTYENNYITKTTMKINWNFSEKLEFSRN